MDLAACISVFVIVFFLLCGLRGLPLVFTIMGSLISNRESGSESSESEGGGGGEVKDSCFYKQKAFRCQADMIARKVLVEV